MEFAKLRTDICGISANMSFTFVITAGVLGDLSLIRPSPVLNWTCFLKFLHYPMDIHFVQPKPKFWVTFPHRYYTNNSLRRIMFIIKCYYFCALFLRQRHFENMPFNYDVILNVRHGPFDILGGGAGIFWKKNSLLWFWLKKINLLNGTVKKIICLQ